MKSDLKKILFINTLTSYGFLVWRLVTSIFITRIILFGLGEDNYGFWALLWTVFGYALLLDFGFGKSIQKYTAEVQVTNDYDTFNNFISSIIFSYGVMAVAITLLSIMCAFFLENIFNVSHIDNIRYIKIVFVIFGCGVGFVFPTGFIPEILEGLKRIDIINYVTFASYTIKVIGIFLLFKFGYSLMSLAILTVAMDILPNLVMYFFVKRFLPRFKIKLSQFRFSHIKEVGSFSLYAYLYAIAVMILFRTDSVVLGVMAGVGSVAIYQIGTRISMLFDSLTTQFQDGLPAVAASLYKENDVEKLRWVFFRSSRLSTYICTGAFIGFFLLTKQILFIWLKIKDSDAIYIAHIMLVSAYIAVLFRSVSVKFMQMAGEHKKVAYMMLIECAVNLLMSIILVKLMGVIGVAIGTLVPNLFFSLFVIFPMFSKFTGFSIIYFLKKVYFPVLTAALPTSIFLLYMNYVIAPYSWTFLDLLAYGAASGIIYLLLGLAYFNREEKRKYFGMIPVVRKFSDKIFS